MQISKIITTFAAQMNNWLRYIFNKYVIVLLGFTIFITFVGNRSLKNRFERAQELDSLREVHDSLQRKIDQTEKRIQSITSSKDSLERFARERYFMHAPEEEVYIVQDN